MERNWRDISYLKNGAERQRLAFKELKDLSMLEILRSFDPVLVSTVCLDIDIPESDLDIICELSDSRAFHNLVTSSFGNFTDFKIIQQNGERITLVASFKTQHFPVEIYAESITVEQQNAFRHLDLFARVLRVCGAECKHKVRALKLSGLKTEPAFAKLFRLDGDPYQAVFELSTLSDSDLLARFMAFQA